MIFMMKRKEEKKLDQKKAKGKEKWQRASFFSGFGH